MKYIVAIALLLAGVAHAQTRITACNPATPNNALCILWTAPTTNTDGTPITSALTYRVEQQAGTAWTSVATTSAVQHYLTGLAPGTYTFRVLAIAGGRESLPSNTAGRDVPQPTPNPPIELRVVRVTIWDGVPVYRIASDGHSLTGTMYGQIPAGRSCGEFVVRWRNLNWHRVAIRNPESELWATDDASNLAAPCG